MKNNELNIFEIMGEEDPKKKEPGYRGKSSPEARRENRTLNAKGQGQSVSDPFFQDAIDQVFSQVGTGPRTYSDGKPIRTYTEQSASYEQSRSPYGKYKSKLRGIGQKIGAYGAGVRKKSSILPKLSESLKGGWKEILAETAVVLLAVVFIYHFVLTISHVSGDSMSPSFCDGDRVLILRIAKGSIEKGDVIVFETAQGEKLIKRVVATEGDTVDISKSKGGLYVNGEALEESYIYTVTSITDENVTYPITVNSGCYFVLGDNRTNSKDSRNSEIGLVDKKDVIGKVIFDIRGT